MSLQEEKMPKKPILYVTSSPKKMYLFSGRKFVLSFCKYLPDSDLLYMTEKFTFKIDNPNIKVEELSAYPFLLEWLNKYKYLIPKELGGTQPKKLSFWNFKASLWFRKVAALHYAKAKYGDQYDNIVWVDNDCEFLQPLTDQYVLNMFHGKGVIYFLGSYRLMRDMGIESGFVGFSNTVGYAFLDRLFSYFMGGAFVNKRRWDDGYVMRLVMKKDPSVGYDLALEQEKKDLIKLKKVRKSVNVMALHGLRKFLVHRKGSHFKNKIDREKVKKK
jgi:hypothetical protein